MGGVLAVLIAVLALVTIMPTGGFFGGVPAVEPVTIGAVVQEVEAGRAAGQVTGLYLWASWCLEAVAGLGAKYPEVIPYGAVFDQEGKLFREWTGWQSIEAWEGAMEELL